MKLAYVCILIAVIAAACSDSTTNGSGGSAGNNGGGGAGGNEGGAGGINDAGADVEYQCGIGPGTMGNSKGVGKYCESIADCSGQEASICAVLGDPTAHFCTKVCDAAMPADVQCGETASCSCNGGGPCGCTPLACASPDGG